MPSTRHCTTRGVSYDAGSTANGWGEHERDRRDRDADTVDQLQRRDYAPLRDYAAIGDGRTAALVARDGSIDWLCLPNLDSPSVFGAILDRDRGGHFALEPEAPYEVTRRYLPDTNVLETTFTTAEGATRVTDAMTLPGDGLASGTGACAQGRGSVRSRADALARGASFFLRRPARRASNAAARSRSQPWAARRSLSATGRRAEPEYGRDSVSGRFEVSAGDQALIAIASAHGAPLVLPGRSQVERRLADTERFWRTWVRRQDL